jgi:hypothetical protein
MTLASATVGGAPLGSTTQPTQTLRPAATRLGLRTAGAQPGDGATLGGAALGGATLGGAAAADADGLDVLIASGDVLTPPPTRLRLSSPDAFIASGRKLTPAPTRLRLSPQDAFIDSGVKLTPDPVRLGLSSPLPLIAPFLLNREWRVDGERLTATDFQATATDLSLTFEVPASDMSIWREYSRAGDVSEGRGFAGAFRTLDRGGRDPVEVRPPFIRLKPFQPSVEFFVTGYSETELAPDRFEVSLQFRRVTNRGQGFPQRSESGADFLFGFDYGTLALDASQVSPRAVRGDTAGGTDTVVLRLDDDQAAAVLDNLGFPGGVEKQSVPDGADIRVDESPGQRQTVTVTAPADATLPSGDYAVSALRLEQNGYDPGRRYAVELTMHQL